MPRRASSASASGGTTQSDRWPPALDPAWAPVDARSPADLLDFACRFASLIQYYDLDDREAGDWVDFLTREPLVMLASVAATDLRRLDARLASLAHRIREERRAGPKRARLVALYDAVLDLPRQVDRWHRGLSVPGNDALVASWHERLGQAIDDTLRASVQRLKAYDLGAGLPGILAEPLGLDYSGFSGRWRLQDVVPDPSIYSGASESERIDYSLQHVVPLWRAMADRAADWSAAARPQLARALERGAVVQPHVALLVAFTRLFGTAQDTLNTVAARRTELYYRRMLREQPRPATPDLVHVAFRATPGQEPVRVTVPAGTGLAAGKDAAARDVVYETRDDITVTSAALDRILTLRVISSPVIAGGPPMPERVLARDVSADANAESWAAFGSDGDPPAELGFAIAAPALELSGGERTIRIDIRHAPCPQATRDVLTAIMQRTGAAESAVLDRVLGEAFALGVSTLDGWLDVDEYRVVHPTDRRHTAFSLQFTLPATAPPMTRLDGAPGGAAAPVVRVHLRQHPLAIDGRLGRLTVYPLSVLAAIRITDVQVHVAVVGLPNVKVFNPDAQLDPARPFPAFGALPAVGSALHLEHVELFSKQLERLALRIGWFALPASRTGFAGHYRQYVVDPDGVIRDRLFDNQTFRAAVSVERPGSWTILPPPDGGDLHLFRTAGNPAGVPDADGPLSPTTELDMRATALAAPAGYQPSEGAIRIELRQPAYAFGHALYAPNTVHAVLGGHAGDGWSETACRAEIAILDDTRRRLQQVLDAGTDDRAALLRAISPVSWPRRAARHVRGAYLNVTGAGRAYFGAQAGREPQSDWIVRSRHAETDDVPTDASGVDEESYSHLIHATLRSSVAALLDAAAACLDECLNSVRDRVDRSDWDDSRERLAAANRAATPQRLAALRALHMRLANPAGGADGSFLRMRTCQAVLQAASWVHDCEADTDYLDGRYLRSIRSNLRTCIGLLRSSYDAYVNACANGGRRTRAPWLPNAPYLPRIEALAVDYTAHGRAEFCHLLPFGGWRPLPLADAEPPTLIPRFAHPGNLYLGLSALVTPQTLNLFVRQGSSRAAEGSGISWEYLDGDRWLPIDAPRDRDTTSGLQTSGTIALSLPAIAARHTTLLPGDRRWVRAIVRSDPFESPLTAGMTLHAVTAVRRTVGAAIDLDRPLPPGRIGAFLKPVKGIAAVVQPMASFGGRPSESDRAFHTRLSEHLRHRGRAVTAWDYERLVLQRFPMIWKARVLPARRRSAGEPNESVGHGHVRIMIVPGPECPDATDPIAPRVSRERLAAFEAELRALTGSAVQCHLVNPIYVRIRVSASIRWRDGGDPYGSARNLNTALLEHLSPWRHLPSDSPYWLESEIVHVIRARPDVMSVESIVLDYEPDDPDDRDEDRYLPTSAPAHDIRAATPMMVGVADGY